SGARGRADECGFEIRDQVIRRLETNRKANEVARCGEGGVCGRRMRHPRRVLDQALDAAERLGQFEDLSARNELDGFFFALREERDHPTGVMHLSRGDLVSGMRRQAWVQGSLDS